MTLGDIILNYRSENKVSQRQFAIDCDLSNAYISKIENKAEKSAMPSITALKKLAKGMHMTLDDLLILADDIPVSLAAQSDMMVDDLPKGYNRLPETEPLPVVGAIACGTPITAEQNILGYVNAPTVANADFCLVCKGDSMIDAGICDGDIVYIRQQEQVENGQIAAVRVDGEATLKRFYFDGKKVTLMPANGAYAPLMYVGDEINDLHIEGLAVGLYHNL